MKQRAQGELFFWVDKLNKALQCLPQEPIKTLVGWLSVARSGGHLQLEQLQGCSNVWRLLHTWQT